MFDTDEAKKLEHLKERSPIAELNGWLVTRIIPKLHALPQYLPGYKVVPRGDCDLSLNNMP